jgi:hypothetical protein
MKSNEGQLETKKSIFDLDPFKEIISNEKRSQLQKAWQERLVKEI